MELFWPKGITAKKPRLPCKHRWWPWLSDPMNKRDERYCKNCSGYQFRKRGA